MTLMSRLALALDTRTEHAPVAPPGTSVPSAKERDTDDLIAVVSAAVARYRSGQR